METLAVIVLGNLIGAVVGIAWGEMLGRLTDRFFESDD